MSTATDKPADLTNLINAARLVKTNNLSETDFEKYKSLYDLSTGEPRLDLKEFNATVETATVLKLHQLLEDFFVSSNLPVPEWLNLENFLNPTQETDQQLELVLTHLGISFVRGTAMRKGGEAGVITTEEFYETKLRVNGTTTTNEVQIRGVYFPSFFLTVASYIYVDLLHNQKNTADRVHRLAQACYLLDEFKKADYFADKQYGLKPVEDTEDYDIKVIEGETNEDLEKLAAMVKVRNAEGEESEVTFVMQPHPEPNDTEGVSWLVSCDLGGSLPMTFPYPDKDPYRVTWATFIGGEDPSWVYDVLDQMVAKFEQPFGLKH